ncbi:MAG: hypothetical protein ACI4I5_03695 [Acutalibacteraceae bacterium]
MADYKEKINEVKGSVMDVAANITSEENKQKISNAAGTVAQKAKGMSKKQKLIALCAVVAVVVIALIAKGGGTKPEDALKSYLTEKNYTLIENMKVIYDTKMKVQSITLDGDFQKAHLYVMTCETEYGNNPITHRFGLYQVMILDDGEVNVDSDMECSDEEEFEALVEGRLRSIKESIKQQKKSGTLK